MVAGITPAVRSACGAELHSLAGCLSADEIDGLTGAPSPQVRIGARLLGNLRTNITTNTPTGEEPPPWPGDVRVSDVESQVILDGGTLREAEIAAAALADANPDAARSATNVLAALRPVEAVCSLWASLPCASPAAQREILRCLREIDADALRLLAAISMRSRSHEQRVAGLTALGELADEPVEPAVLALADPVVKVRMAALRTVARRPQPELLEAVGRRVSDPRPDVRCLAVCVLRDSGDSRAIDYLVSSAADSDESVRRLARAAIRSLASTEVVNRIVRALSTPSSEETAHELLVELGPVATDDLLVAIDTAPHRVRELIGDVLRATGAGRRIQQLLIDPDPLRRLIAVEGVGAMRGREAARTLLRLLEDPEPALRARAGELLGELRDLSVTEELAFARVREVLGGALRRLTVGDDVSSDVEDKLE
jgi:HEAT repeat protein